MIRMAAKMPRRTRAVSRAPIFCPQYVAMARPIFSKTQVKRYFMRIDAVKAATHVVPRALLALWSMMMPMPVMENCKPIGTPLLSRMEMRLLSKVRSLPLGIRIFTRPTIYHPHRMHEKSCESSVASPAPKTPNPQTRMSSTSRTILTTDEKMRKKNGCFESPRARRNPARRL